jgi:ribose transport system permease protein
MTRLMQAPARRLGPARPALAGLIPYLLVLVLFVINLATIQGFGSKANIIGLLVLSSFLGLASVGQTLAVIIGAVDLSIPAVIGMSDVVLTQLYGSGWPFCRVGLLLLGLVAVIGAVNALATVLLRVHSLIVTLGTGLIITGAVLTWRPGSTTGNVPAWLTSSVSAIGRTGPVPVPEVLVLWAGISLLVIAFQRWMRIGWEIYATGSNPVAAPLARIRTTRAIVAVFIISALFATTTGVLLAGYSGAANEEVGNPYLFETLTAVVIGGTSLIGGRGGYGRTIAGTLVLSELTVLLVGVGFGSAMQQAMLGILILILVLIFGRETHISLKV